MISINNKSLFFKKLFLATFMASPFLISAQHNNEFYNKGELVTVQAGAEVYIQGDMHHYNAASNFNNNGLVEVQGHAYGDNAFQQRGTGIVRMFNRSVNTTETQKISGSYAVRGGQNQIGVNDGSFYDLQLANRQGIVHLEGNGFVADVRNTVDFMPTIAGQTIPTNRIITHTTSQNNGNDYSAIFGIMNTAQGLASMLNNTVSSNGELSDVDNAYIEGKMRRAIAANGGAYGFPVGNQPGVAKGQGLQYVNLTINEGNTYDYLTNYFQIASDNTISGTPEECGGVVNWFSGTNHGEWMITAGTVGTTPYSLQIFPQHYENLSGTEFFITKDNAIAGNLNQCGTQPEGLIRGGFTGFSEFGFASTTVILNHKLLNIKATPIENRFIQVAWQVDNAHEVFMYEVERSTNAIDFEYLADIFGEGDMAFDFNFDDMRALANVQYYYRVKSILWDGSYTYSPIVSAKLQDKTNAQQAIALYPNPTSTVFNLGISLENNNTLEIRVLDVVGRIMHQEKVSAQIGLNTYTIAVNNWSAGLYYVQIVGQDFTAIKEVIKTN